MLENSLVQLIKLWTEFNLNKSVGDLNDFATWLLAKTLAIDDSSDENLSNTLLLLDISRMIEMQAKEILGESSDLQTFRVLTIAQRLKNAKKQDIVIESLLEQSTGFTSIKNLVERKLLKEVVNSQDKRSLLIKITAKGSEFIKEKKNLLKSLDALSKVNLHEKQILCKHIYSIYSFYKNNIDPTPQVKFK
jgi:DNA-binding MarR family transcriptional regulator